MYVCAYDLHYPKVDWPSWKALMQFLEENKVDGFIFGGDQMNNDSISHHTRGKPLLRSTGEYKKDEKGFIQKILDPLDAVLEGEKIWIQGNHDYWEQELIEHQPELDGIQRQHAFELDARGWNFIECGDHYKHGKLTFIHGEQLTGIGNQTPAYPSRRAVEAYCSSVVYGHLHSPQTFTKVLPHDNTEKWMAFGMPTMGNINPGYLRNRPTAWLNGFGIVEFAPNGNFNVHTIITAGGKFCFGGKVYGD